MSGYGAPGKIGEISLTPRQRAEKLATRSLVEAVGGFEAAAIVCRLSKSQLHRCCDLHGRDFLPIDVVSALEEIAGSRPITQLHAREQGCSLICLPPAEPSTADLHTALAEAMREHGDVTARLIEALGDGHCTAAEARPLVDECTEAAEGVLRLRQLLEQSAENA